MKFILAFLIGCASGVGSSLLLLYLKKVHFNWKEAKKLKDKTKTRAEIIKQLNKKIK